MRAPERNLTTFVALRAGAALRHAWTSLARGWRGPDSPRARIARICAASAAWATCATWAGCGSKSAPEERPAPPRDAAVVAAPRDAAPPSDAPEAAPVSALDRLPRLDFVAPYGAPGDRTAARRLADGAREAEGPAAIRLLTQALAADPSDAAARYELASRYARAGDARALALLAELTRAGCDGCLAFRDDARWSDDWQALWDSDAMFELVAYRRPHDPVDAEASLSEDAEEPRTGEPPIRCAAGTRWAGTWRANRIDDVGEVWCARAGGVRHGPYYKLDNRYGPADLTQEIRGEYRAGKRHGLWRTTLSIGDVTEGAYAEDRPRGVWLELGREQLTFAVYVDGKLHGRRLQVVDDELRHVLAEERYDHGVLDGPVRHYQDQPWTLWESGSYVQGKKHGEWLYFDEAGRRRIREHWDAGVPHGAFEYWDAAGALVDRTELAHGTGRWVAYDADGRKLAEGALAGNKRTGVWGELAEDNAGWDTGEYAAGVAAGTWQQLAAPGGRKLAEGGYAAGQRAGAWTFWRPDGTLRAKGSFRAGKPDGAWTLFDERGKAPVQLLGFRAGALATVDGVRATRTWQRAARRARFDRAPAPISLSDDAPAAPL